MASAGEKRKSENVHECVPKKKTFGHWGMGLLSSMDDPNARIDADDKVVIIKDKYPKAKHHFLVLPREKIPNLKSLKKDNLELLKHMYKKGVEVAEAAGTKVRFRYGYHAVPSMSHLHLHVISQDFDSPSLKTKKHWNSFTSDYFIDSDAIIRQLEETGQILSDSRRAEELLKQPLRCHVCKQVHSTMPALKTHIVRHQKDDSLAVKDR